MPNLFEPMKIGKMEVKNRFVRSAVMENIAKKTGEVTDELIKLCHTLAKGEVGLIIPGFMYIHPLGQGYKHQTGIFSDDMIPGLKRIVDVIHKEDGKVAFQLGHAGMQTSKNLIKTTPKGPSGKILNPTTFAKSMEMTEEDIQESIEAFSDAAVRAVEAGADAIQLHSAHGYLINQFLSSFYNRRKDDWGGSDENRFRYLKEIINKIKKVIPKAIPILIKLNSRDYTPRKGIIPSLASKYAEWIANLGISGIEVSCGSASFSIFNMCRGDIPVQEILQALPDKFKPPAEKMFQDMVGKFDLEENYNLEAGKKVKSVIGDIPLILVGGLRTKVSMEEIVDNGYADFISMARPFIREPFLVKSFKEGKQEKAACISCNRCLAAVPNDYPVRCYTKKWPVQKK